MPENLHPEILVSGVLAKLYQCYVLSFPPFHGIGQQSLRVTGMKKHSVSWNDMTNTPNCGCYLLGDKQNIGSKLGLTVRLQNNE